MSGDYLGKSHRAKQKRNSQSDTQCERLEDNGPYFPLCRDPYGRRRTIETIYDLSISRVIRDSYGNIIALLRDNESYSEVEKGF